MYSPASYGVDCNLYGVVDKCDMDAEAVADSIFWWQIFQWYWSNDNFGVFSMQQKICHSIKNMIFHDFLN